MAYTENSGEGGVSSNSQSNYTTRNSLKAGDIIESNKAMFSTLTEVLQTTLTSMGNNCINTPNVKCSRLISWKLKILMIQILGKMMK